MPVYLYWGEDDFAIAQAVAKLKQQVLVPDWEQFNYDKIPGDISERIVEGLNQAMTPVFGEGGRLVWLVETNLCQQCSESLLRELERTISQIPTSSHLLLTTSKKPDKRLKSTKLIEKHSNLQEFSLIPPWKIDEIIQKVENLAQEKNLKLTAEARELLAESVGSNTRQLYSELAKLELYAQGKTIDEKMVANLVNVNNQNSLQLATIIAQGQTSKALVLITELIQQNEPALKIVATLVGQFRTWVMVKLKIEAGEKDEKAIAAFAEIGNPKRIYFIRKEIQALSAKQLLDTLPILLDLEFNLKRGAEPLAELQVNTIRLCNLLSSQK